MLVLLFKTIQKIFIETEKCGAALLIHKSLRWSTISKKLCRETMKYYSMMMSYLLKLWDTITQRRIPSSFLPSFSYKDKKGINKSVEFNNLLMLLLFLRDLFVKFNQIFKINKKNKKNLRIN